MSSVSPAGWFTQLFAKPAEKPQVSPFHAVAIRCELGACQAAQGELGKRHLSAEPPMLPLEQCDRPDQCECRYQHYEDRRGESRRSADMEHGSSPQTDAERTERRAAKDRRAKEVPKDESSFSVHEGSYYQYVGEAKRAAMLEASEADGFDPYNSGRFDESKKSDSNSGK